MQATATQKAISKDILGAFVEEVKGYLPNIRREIDAWSKDREQFHHLEEAHRLAHTIKGASSMMGLTALSHMAFLVEESLEEVAAGQLDWSGQAAHTLSSTLSHIETCVFGIDSGTVREQPLLVEVIKAFRRLRNQPEAGAESEADKLCGHSATPVERTVNGSSAPKISVPRAGETAHGRSTQAQFLDIPADVLDTFRMEAEELIQRISEQMLSAKNEGASAEMLQEIRRCVHTLKGAAGSVGFLKLSSLAHRMEDLLDEVGAGEVSYTSEMEALLFATVDAMTDMAVCDELDNGSMGALLARYTAVLQPSASKSGSTSGDEARDSYNSPPIELLEAFRPEADEHLAKAAEFLRQLQNDPGQKQIVQEIRRGIHTLKGAAGVVGIHAVAKLAHRTEDVLDNISEASGPVREESIFLLFAALDAIGDLVSGAPMDSQLLAGLENRLTAALGGNPPALPAAADEAPFDINFTAAPAEATKQGPADSRRGEYVRVPLERLDELVRLVSELVVSRSTFEQHLTGYEHEVDELRLSLGRLKRLSNRFDIDFEVNALKSGVGQVAIRTITPKQGTDKHHDFDSLEFDRYTDLHLAARDLAETSADVTSATAELGNRTADFNSYLNRMARLTSDVQDRLMRLRMVPVASLATRLHRTVRVTGERCGKNVDLIIEGQEVELDKAVLEEIAGPLEHLLRNAVDHGIESGEMRRALGKAASGTIRLRAYNEGTQVVIEISDDGGGIDSERLRAASVHQGFQSESAVTQLSEKDLLQLIFQPGFSTAKELSEVSGRGVGMDIVRSTVFRLKGDIDVDTAVGRGTKFIIRLPMTLAIVRVLLVKANGQTLAIPLGVVRQILRIERKQFERVGQKTVLRVGGKVHPALRLGEVLGGVQPEEDPSGRAPVLVLDVGEQSVALLIDEIVEAREIVVKTMGSLLRRVRCITGATLMGDGSVVLIVNPGELVQSAVQRQVSIGGGGHSDSATPKKSLNVLIVDDSVSVRRVLTNLARNHGWTPVTAKDGIEALEILQSGTQTFDAALLDIEMPRMDGYELTTALRSQKEFRNLPIVMLTSRAGEKHRNKAFELGVTDYLVKPYQDDTLVAVVRRVVREAREAPVA